MAIYTNNIPVELAKWFDLFDDVPYKYVKHLLDEDDIELEITDIPCDTIGFSKIKFEFSFSYDTEDQLMYRRTQPFIVETEYGNTSDYRMMLDSLKLETDDESESDDEPQQ